jgi:ATP synthase protein I
MNDPGKKTSGTREAYRAVGPYLTLGIQFVVMILVCIFAGQWLDDKFDTKPIFTLVGAVFGMIAGFYHFFKVVLYEGRKPEDNA